MSKLTNILLPRHMLLFFAATLATLLTSGCSAPYQLGPDTTPIPGVAMQGRIFGGDQPIKNAKVKMWAAGTTGYGAGAKSLLTTPVTSGPDGGFSLANDFMCPSATSEIYLTAEGGDPGIGGTTDNSAIFLVAAAGPCGAITTSTYIFINEASTVAAAFALAQFTNVTTEIIGSSPGNPLGLQTAFSTVTNLVSLATGVPLAVTAAGNGKPPQAEIDTIADALSACVNTASSDSDPCGTLLYDSTPDTLDVAKDTFQAALYLALYPGNDISDIYGLATPQSPFQPIMGKAPNDWTMGIQFSGASINYPDGLAIDQLGDVWIIAAQFSDYGSAVTELNPLGAPKSPPLEGYDVGNVIVGPVSLDAAGDLWMASPDTGNGNSGIIELNSKGAMISPNDLNGVGYAQGKFLFPQAVAIDLQQNVWIADAQILIELDKTGKLISPTTTPASTLLKGYPIAKNIDAFLNASATDIAIDGDGNVWVADGNLDSIHELDKNGGVLSPDAGWSGGGLDGQTFGFDSPNYIAIDGQGFVWTSNTASGAVSEFRNTGTPLSPSSGYTNAGIYDPKNIAVDGAGNIWFTNPILNSVSELNQSAFAVSPFDGYGGAGFNGPNGIGIDASGNVWVANFGAGFNGTVTEMVGAAVPTVTPITPTMIGSEP